METEKRILPTHKPELALTSLNVNIYYLCTDHDTSDAPSWLHVCLVRACVCERERVKEIEIECECVCVYVCVRMRMRAFVLTGFKCSFLSGYGWVKL